MVFVTPNRHRLNREQTYFNGMDATEGYCCAGAGLECIEGFDWELYNNNIPIDVKWLDKGRRRGRVLWHGHSEFTKAVNQFR